MEEDLILLNQCISEEEKYRFSNFSHEDALALGMHLIEAGKEHQGPVAIEISLHDLVVFRHFPTGTSGFHEMWLKSKRNMVIIREISTLHAFALLAVSKENQLDDWHLPPLKYAACGGGFPIRNISGTVLGAVCVSGLPHLEDHAILMSGIHALWSGKMQREVPACQHLDFPAE